MPITQEKLAELRRVKTKHELELMQKVNVVGVGIGLRKRCGEATDEPVIVVSVTHKVPSWTLDQEDLVPCELDGVPVDVRAVGRLRAFDT
jgi:hypothetical protein